MEDDEESSNMYRLAYVTSSKIMPVIHCINVIFFTLLILLFAPWVVQAVCMSQAIEEVLVGDLAVDVSAATGKTMS